MVTKAGQVPKFPSCDPSTCFNNAVQVVFIFQRKAGKPAEEGETQETFEKRLIKTAENNRADGKRICGEDEFLASQCLQCSHEIPASPQKGA